MAAQPTTEQGTPDPTAHRGRGRRGGGRDEVRSGPAWMRSAPAAPHRAASSTTTSTTRPTCCAPWPKPPTTPCSTRQRALFAGLDTWDGLQRWVDALVDLQQQRGGRGGCPIANLVGQLGERDDDIRAVLASGFDRWEAHIRAGLAAMVAAGELRPDTDVEWLAASTLASLQGGLILAQARRDPRALRRALDGALALIEHVPPDELTP